MSGKKTTAWILDTQRGFENGGKQRRKCNCVNLEFQSRTARANNGLKASVICIGEEQVEEKKAAQSDAFSARGEKDGRKKQKQQTSQA